jgi:hypothetical protein
MKGDFSRDTFDITKHFSRVLQQQGRVQLDADWNEQTAILLHYLHTLAADLIGPFAGPAGDSCGFAISRFDDKKDFTIGSGRYYVDGILCENEAPVNYTKQRDFPNPKPKLTELDDKKSYLVYLDVWERHITALEDDTIREKALNGPDTGTRAQVVWQVKLSPDPSRSETSPTALTKREEVVRGWEEWVKLWQPPHLGCLRARVNPPKDTKDPCLTAPDAKYRGPENQLYRVEIHTGGKVGEATFKWSRDNGAIVTACALKGVELTVQNPRGFAANQWVELIADEQELRGEPGTLIKIAKVEGDVLSLDQEALKKLQFPPTILPTKVRRWDQHEAKDAPLIEGAIKTFNNKDGLNATWLSLEDGIEIQFLEPTGTDGNHYRAGDYWLIPARVATGDIEWPDELDASGALKIDGNGNKIPAAKPPNGIRHHYAPLAILKMESGNWAPISLRCEFHPLNNFCNLYYSYGEEGIGGHLLCNPPEGDK